MKKKKVCLHITFALFIATVLFGIPSLTHAQFIPTFLTDPSSMFGAKIAEITYGLALDAVNLAVEGILYVITFIAGVVFWLGAQLISFFFSLNNQILDIPMVTIGWGIVRDIANLGFVLAIIVIALATIVRYQEYGAKKILPKLIAAAILVNFSLTLGGVILDFSNTITGFFLDRASPTSVSSGGLFHIADELATAFSPQKLAIVATTTSAAIISKTQDTLNSIASLFFAGAFTLLSALTLLGIALMLLTRFIWLILLLIVSPITWFFWVIPDLSGEFKKWWSSFFKWCFYAPTLSFFLYLTILSVDKLKDLNVAYQQSAVAIFNGVDPTKTASIHILSGFQQISNMVVIVGLLIGGLMVAQSMSGTGADQMMKLATKAGKGVGKWAGGRAKQTGKNVGRRALAGGVDESGKTRLERVGAKLGKIPLVGRAFTGISAASSKAKDSMKKEVEEKEKKYDVRTVDDLNAIAERKINNTPQDDVALMKSIAKKGGWNKLKDTTKNRLVGSAKRLGAGDQITPLIPQLAGEFATLDKNDSPEERAVKVKNAEAKAASKLTEVPKNIDDSKETEAFYENNAQYFSSGMIDQFGNSTAKGSDVVRGALKRGMNKQASGLKLDVLDRKGNPIKDLSPQLGYGGVKTLRKKMKEHTSNIEGYDADIDALTPEIDDLDERIKKPTENIQRYNNELKELRLKLEKVSDNNEEKRRVLNDISKKTEELTAIEKTKKELEKKKEEARKGLREISEKRKNLRLEKTAMQKALDKVHDQSRDIARAIDGLDKMENNPSYKNNTP